MVSCRECNAAKGNLTVEEFLADRPEELAAIRRIRRSSLADASQMNIIVPRLIAVIEDMRLPTVGHDAYTTSWTRKRLGVSKTHVNDALCVGAPDSMVNIPERKILAQSVGHGDRQMLRPADRHGNPRGQGYRDYCAFDRQRQGYTTCPGHRSRGKRVSRIASGDLVRLSHKKHGVLRGYASLDKKRGRVAVSHGGKPVSVKAQDALLLTHNHGYRVSVDSNIE